jgi:predicted site-specific integrase-resolvase
MALSLLKKSEMGAEMLWLMSGKLGKDGELPWAKLKTGAARIKREKVKIIVHNFIKIIYCRVSR